MTPIKRTCPARRLLLPKGMNLFTYGTLMDPAVWARVAQESCPALPATLTDYEARQLRNHTFPGLVEAPGSLTPGLLYQNVSEAAMARLDAYEDDFYIRVDLTVILDDGSPVTAAVYLMSPEHRDIVLPERWLPPAGQAGT